MDNKKREEFNNLINDIYAEARKKDCNMQISNEAYDFILDYGKMILWHPAPVQNAEVQECSMHITYRNWDFCTKMPYIHHIRKPELLYENALYASHTEA